MTQFNIALLHYTCPPVVGGVEEIIRQHASLFARYDHRVKVFAGEGGVFTDVYPIELNALMSSRNPRILQIHKELSDKYQELEFWTEELFSYLVRVLEPFDVLIAHNVLTMHYNLPMTLAIHRLANNQNIKVVSWNHDSPFFYDQPPLYLKGEQWVALTEYNPNIYYVTISEERRREFRKLYGADPIDVIPDGIEPTTFLNLSPHSINMLREKRLLEAELLMVQPCRLHPRKNIELSIQVLKALREKGLHARLLLTGAYDPHEKDTTEYHRKLRNLSKQLHIEEHILIAAEYFSECDEDITVDSVMVRDFCVIADLLFIPSLREGFGIPLLEAGMLKLPIVCSDIPPFREIGKDNVQYFSPGDSPDQIADKVIAFVSDLKPHRMFRHVMRNYGWDDIYHHMLLPLLQRVIS